MTAKANTLPKILLVDDEPDILEFLKYSIEKEDFVVYTASNGKDGVAEALKHQPQLILLDVMMPGMDGPSTLKQLQQQFDLSQVPVVFMTAKVQSSEIESYKALGASDVVVKPFDPMTLSEQIRQIWQRQQR